MHVTRHRVWENFLAPFGFVKNPEDTRNVFLESALLFLVLCSLALMGCQKGRHDDSAPEKPSIALITVDTLRADALGCNGSERAYTPNIDRLAQIGVLFENAMCQAPATGPSFASMMTSKYPADCGVLHSTMVLKEPELTLAEVLRENGYRTGGFISCTLLKSEYGFSQGFDVFDEFFEKNYSQKDRERGAKATTRAAISWLTSLKEKPFFLWVHYFDPHTPYENHEASIKNEEVGTEVFLQELGQRMSRSEIEKHLPEIKELYTKEVGFLDEQIGRLLGILRRMEGGNNMVIAFAADHGEELFDHGYFHGHYLSMTQSVLHTPLILAFPSKLPEGIRVSGLVENIDIFPTLLALAGIEPPQGLGGINLTKSVMDPSLLAERCTYAQREPYAWMPGGNASSVRYRNWKYTHFSKGPDHLLDLQSDPGELVNLVNEHENVRGFLQGKLIQWLSQASTEPRTVGRENLSPRDTERLKSLGYVQ